MTQQQPEPARAPRPIDPAQLDKLIQYHRDSLSSHRHQMSPSVEWLQQQTIRVLEHYRDLCAVIDRRDKEPDPLEPAPSQPLAKTSKHQDVPA